MGIRAEHDSLEVFLKGALSDDARSRVLFVSFTQWGFALAALADSWGVHKAFAVMLLFFAASFALLLWKRVPEDVRA